LYAYQTDHETYFRFTTDKLPTWVSDLWAALPLLLLISALQHSNVNQTSWISETLFRITMILTDQEPNFWFITDMPLTFYGGFHVKSALVLLFALLIDLLLTLYFRDE
jgi:hypothetical protein